MDAPEHHILRNIFTSALNSFDHDLLLVAEGAELPANGVDARPRTYHKDVPIHSFGRMAIGFAMRRAACR